MVNRKNESRLLIRGLVPDKVIQILYCVSHRNVLLKREFFREISTKLPGNNRWLPKEDVSKLTFSINE